MRVKRAARFRHVELLLCLLAWLVCPPVRAMDLYSYDLDSLVYLSSEVVEADLGGLARVQGYPVRAATVTAVYKGRFRAGQTVSLDANVLDFFCKAGRDFFRGGGPLAQGDHVFLFLMRARPVFLYNVPKDAEIYWPAPSGVKLVQDGKALSFQQFDNPGPYVCVTPQIFPKGVFPGTAAFRAQIRQSLRDVAALAPLLTAPATPQSVPRILALLRARSAKEKTAPFGRGRDAIAETLCKNLAGLHDYAALSAALNMGSWGLDALAQGFDTAAGHDYLLQEIGDARVPIESRLRLAGVLGELSFSDSNGNSPLDWPRVAALARTSESQEKLCLALLDTLERFANVTGQLTRQKAASPAQQKQAAQVQSLLADWYPAARSEPVRFAIEKVAVYGGQACYEALRSPCGLVPALATPGSNPPLVVEKEGRRLWVSYEALTPFENEVDVSVFVLLIESDTRKATALPSPFSLKDWTIGSGGGGSNSLLLPNDLPPGAYSVALQFRRGSQIVGTSHSFPIDLKE